MGRLAPTLARGTETAEPVLGDRGARRPDVAGIQRMRLIRAMCEVCSERGMGGIAVTHVVRRAGVSRRTFYEIFDDCEDCFLATFEMAVVRAGSYVAVGYDPTVGWAERIRGGLEALLRFFEDEPECGRLLVIESASASAKTGELRRGLVDQMVAAVDAGRESANGSSSATALTAEGVVGGVISLIHDRLVCGDIRGLTELANPLMSMIVLPFLGPAAARREFGRPLVSSPQRAPCAAGNPLKDLRMRLTYRTVRVLAAVAANPRGSNRAIGEASGVADQGQISKLLARLERLGLLENTLTARATGSTNAWVLTKRGEEVAGALAAEASAC
jgi:AcrR family transcriptional regulator